MPSVLVDATAIPRDRGGVGRYVDSLIAALATSGAEITVIAQARDVDDFRALGVKTVAASKLIASAPLRFVWEQLSLPSIARRAGVEVLHSPHYTFPILWRGGQVVTVHDLTFFTLPEVHSPLKRVFFRWWIRASGRRRRLQIIAVSQATATDLERIVGVEAARITVSHLGYDSSLFHRPDDDSRAALSGSVAELPDSWIAFLGTLEPRKNIVALIDGYSEATETSDSPLPSLLLAGGDGWDEGVEPALGRAKNAGADVRSLGYLPLEALPAFLGDSTVFVYPSLGEGFGLPVLEAMASGAAVLTTDRMSLPEVGGDAVVYTGVSATEIASALVSLVADPVRRSELSSAAVERAGSFTWAAAASRHEEVYARAGRSG
jgi:glycosyltransferase involved in cell wall biosynthesis